MKKSLKERGEMAKIGKVFMIFCRKADPQQQLHLFPSNYIIARYIAPLYPCPTNLTKNCLLNCPQNYFVNGHRNCPPTCPKLFHRIFWYFLTCGDLTLCEKKHHELKRPCFHYTYFTMKVLDKEIKVILRLFLVIAMYCQASSS